MTNRQKLIDDLKEFGLNPKDWSLVGDLIESPTHQLIIHKTKKICLIGEIKELGSLLGWSSISYLVA